MASDKSKEFMLKDEFKNKIELAANIYVDSLINTNPEDWTDQQTKGMIDLIKFYKKGQATTPELPDFNKFEADELWDMIKNR